MSSILTNNGAMVALQTLRGINDRLGQTQNAIATGKDVSNAKDNSAVWAISKVMESDVAGFRAISDNLGLGQATTQVAREAAETTTDLLKQMKEKIVAAQESNVDRNKIQTDIEALRDQIGSVTGAAQFNGLNLLNNRDVEAGSGSVSVLSSLDRSATGVSSSNITVGRQDLTTAEADWDVSGAAVAANIGSTAAGSSTAQVQLTQITNAMVGTGSMFRINSLGANALSEAIVVSVFDGDSLEDVQERVVTALNFASDSEDVGLTFTAGTNGRITGIYEAGVTMSAFAAANIESLTGNTDGGATLGGGLSLLNNFDVTTDEGAAAALGAVESMIQTSIDAAAAFGSTEGRIETQQNFVSGLMDAMKSGIGTLVDADMEEESARLQALQVQQQLGVQALSIANQAPQQLLSLFR